MLTAQYLTVNIEYRESPQMAFEVPMEEPFFTNISTTHFFVRVLSIFLPLERNMRGRYYNDILAIPIRESL